MKVSPRVGVLILGASIFAAACGGATDEDTGSTSNSANQPAPTNAQQQQANTPAKATFLLVYADTTSGSLGTTDEEKAALSCVQKNRFPQGESIVWRVRVIDPATGKPMTDKDVKTVTLTFPDGTTKDMKFGPHPKGKTDDYFWAASFKIPADYPTGAFKYKLVATGLDGVTGTFDQFNVASSLLQVIPAGTR
jgi:hypothetical protein